MQCNKWVEVNLGFVPEWAKSDIGVQSDTWPIYSYTWVIIQAVASSTFHMKTPIGE
jgi:hypothetical protein